MRVLLLLLAAAAGAYGGHTGGYDPNDFKTSCSNYKPNLTSATLCTYADADSGCSGKIEEFPMFDAAVVSKYEMTLTSDGCMRIGKNFMEFQFELVGQRQPQAVSIDSKTCNASTLAAFAHLEQVLVELCSAGCQQETLLKDCGFADDGADGDDDDGLSPGAIVGIVAGVVVFGAGVAFAWRKSTVLAWRKSTVQAREMAYAAMPLNFT